MKIITCFLLLALVAAVSCTACHKRVHRRHDTCLSPKTSYYFPPKHSSKKSLNVLGFFLKGLHHKLKVSIGIFKFYSTSVISKSVDKSVAAIVNLARAYGLIINEWVDGLGTIFSKIVMAISRIIFCVLGNPWEGKTYFDRFITHKSCRTPAICGHKYGVRYGWQVFTGEYTSYESVLEFYGLKGLDIEGLIKKHAGVGISGLTGNKLVIARAIVSLYGILQRDINVWKRDDIILVSRYMITVAASVTAGHYVSAKVDVVDGFIAFINLGFKNNGFPDMSTYRADILKDLEGCNSESFNGAIVPFDEDGNDNGSGNGGGNGGNDGNNGNNAGNNGNNADNNGNNAGNNGNNGENGGNNVGNGGNNGGNDGNNGVNGGNNGGGNSGNGGSGSGNTQDENNGSNTGKNTKKVVKKVTTVSSDDEENSAQSQAAAAAASQSSSASNGTQSSSSAAASSAQSVSSASKKTTTVETEIDYIDYETSDVASDSPKASGN